MSLAGKADYVATRSSLPEFYHSELRNVNWNEKKIAEKVGFLWKRGGGLLSHYDTIIE